LNLILGSFRNFCVVIVNGLGGRALGGT
jgi:hypothetical protein